MDKFAEDEKEMVKTRFVVGEDQKIEEQGEQIKLTTETKQIDGSTQSEQLNTKDTPLSAEALEKLLSEPDNIPPLHPSLMETPDADQTKKPAMMILAQCLIMIIACAGGVAVAPLFAPIAMILILIILLPTSRWATGVSNKLDVLTKTVTTSAIVKSIAATSPAVTIIISGFFFGYLVPLLGLDTPTNIPAHNIFTLAGLGALVFYIFHLIVRLGWLFWYPYKVCRQFNQAEGRKRITLIDLWRFTGMTGGLVIAELLLTVSFAQAVNLQAFSLVFLMGFVGIQSLIFYIANKIIGEIEATRTRAQSNAELVALQDGYALDEEIIGYRPMAGTERWMKQRFSHGSIWKPLLLILMVGGILMLNPEKLLMDFFAKLLGPPAGGGAGGGGGLPGIQALLNLNHIFVLCFGGVFLTFVGAFGAWLLRLPTAVLTGPRGLRFMYHGVTGKTDAGISWGDVSEIKLERKLNSASTLSDCLIFKTNKKDVKLKLDNFKSGHDKEKLLHAIESYAPTVPRDPAVMEVLAMPADHSYTEVWMTALSAPPKRERLKPLTQDAVMNEGNYTIVSELGSGGQGFAYLAKNKEGNEVVLKEFVLPIYVDIQARRKALERFENEARLLSRLDNPQVVKLSGFFVEDHRAYLVLEHINGKNLRQLIAEKGTFSEEETKVLLEKMCKILKYLHGLDPPLVHRDFTPDNLILDKDGNLKLIDFNVAQEMQDGTTGTVVGKQAYLPPEQFRGQAVPASDMYAMGATLYYLLTGKDPTPISTLRVSKELPDLDPQLDLLMTQLTSMDPTARPTAEDVLKERAQPPQET